MIIDITYCRKDNITGYFNNSISTSWLLLRSKVVIMRIRLEKFMKTPLIKKTLQQNRILFLLYMLIIIIVTVQSLLLGDSIIVKRHYTQYNNYIIFKQSSSHLAENKDLYQLYPDEQWDLYKYSPTFSLLFGGLAILPDYIGLFLWNLINALPLLLAIRYLPGLTNQKKNLVLLFIIAELITSLQNSQSNALLAGLIILAFGLLERRKYLLATLCIVITIYTKIFGIVAFSLFLFYPQKWRLLIYTVTWLIVFFCLPLLTVTFHQLTFLYKSWYLLLINDHSVSNGLSVMNWLKVWFNITVSKNAILLGGAILFSIPFLRIKEYNSYSFRLLSLSSLLIWVIIFNHMAESPTFIIAISGTAIWYFAQNGVSKTDTILIIAAFIFTSLSVSDVFPSIIRNSIFTRYVVKVVPCILIWFKTTGELLFRAFKPAPAPDKISLRAGLFFPNLHQIN